MKGRGCMIHLDGRAPKDDETVSALSVTLTVFPVQDVRIAIDGVGTHLECNVCWESDLRACAACTTSERRGSVPCKLKYLRIRWDRTDSAGVGA